MKRPDLDHQVIEKEYPHKQDHHQAWHGFNDILRGHDGTGSWIYWIIVVPAVMALLVFGILYLMFWFLTTA